MKHKYRVNICVGLLCVLVIGMLYYGLFIRNNINQMFPDAIQEIATDVTPMLGNDFEIQQRFNYSGMLYGINLMFGTYHNRYTEGEINIELYKGGNLCAQGILKLKDIIDNKVIPIKFNKKYLCEDDEDYTIKVYEGNNYPQNIQLSLYYASIDKIEDNQIDSNFIFNNKLYQGALYINALQGGYESVIFLFMAVLLLGGVSIFCLCFMCIKRKQINSQDKNKVIGGKKFRIHFENIVFVEIVLLGLIYQLVMPPLTIPDEETHFATAYDYTNKILGLDYVDILNDKIDYLNGNNYHDIEGDFHFHDHYKIVARETDAEAFRSMKRYAGIEQYKELIDGIKEPFVLEKENDSFEEDILQLGFFAYLPGILGILLGRILHFNGIITLLLGRLFNLLLYAFVTAFAINKLPKGKMILMVIASFPMNISLAASYSYDGLVLGVSFLFISYTLFLVDKKVRPNIKDYTILSICMFLLGYNKFVYCLLLLLYLPLVIKELKENRKVKNIIQCCLPILFSVLGLVISQLGNISVYAKELSGSGRFTLGDIVFHPLWFLITSLRSIIMYFTTYIGGVIGQVIGQLGSLQVEIQWGIIIAFIVLLFITFLYSQEYEGSYEGSIVHFKLISNIIFILILGCLMVVACTWNTVDRDYFSGIQGRYFTPVLPALIFPYMKKKPIFEVRKNIGEKIIFSVFILNFISILAIFEFVSGRLV